MSGRRTGTSDLEGINNVFPSRLENSRSGSIWSNAFTKTCKCQPRSKRHSPLRILCKHRAFCGRLKILGKTRKPFGVSVINLNAHRKAISKSSGQVLLRVTVHSGNALKPWMRTNHFPSRKSETGSL